MRTETNATKAVCYTAGRILNALDRPALSPYGGQSNTLSEDGTAILISLADDTAPGGLRMLLVRVEDVS